MAKKFFNPDLEIHGDYDVYALACAENRIRQMDSIDSDYCCPYDKDICRQKIVRVQKWERAVEYLAENRINQTFCTKEDMFYACPVPQLDCVRRHRYNELMKTLQQRVK